MRTGAEATNSTPSSIASGLVCASELEVPPWVGAVGVDGGVDGGSAGLLTTGGAAEELGAGVAAGLDTGVAVGVGVAVTAGAGAGCATLVNTAEAFAVAGPKFPRASV